MKFSASYISVCVCVREREREREREKGGRGKVRKKGTKVDCLTGLW